MTSFLIPLQNIPQSFEIALAGVTYDFICKWNAADEGGWVLDIGDANSGLPLAANIPLIVGADCLAGLEYLGINGQLIVFTDGDANAVPTFTNLGVESNLYFLTDVAA